MYDLIIIGAGPSGLTASIYASCFHLKHVVIGKDIGGQLLAAPDILNYPGFTEISGNELTTRMVDQAKARGGEIVQKGVSKINVATNETGVNIFTVEAQDGATYQSRALIVATGTERKKLNVPGEVEYTAKGIHYCAVCDKQDYKDKICCVIGGANSAVQAAVQISQEARKVFILYRGTQLRAEAVWIEQAQKKENISVITEVSVQEIVGDGQKVTGVKVHSDNQENKSLTLVPIEKDILSLDKVFIEIGGVPGSALVIPMGVQMDPGGYIHVDNKLATNIKGVFAAGDLVSYGLSIEQISSAVGLGARATASVFSYLKGNNAPMLWGKTQIGS